MSTALEGLVEELHPWAENVVAFSQVDSTHASALRLLATFEEDDDEPPESAVIVALSQSAGIGRLDRTWESPEGGLYLSWVRTGLGIDTVTRLPMLAAAAVHAGLEACGLSQVSIKWPNDLLVSGRKIAGVLVHARHGATISAAVGIGVNIARSPEVTTGSGVPPTSVAETLDIAAEYERWSGIVAREIVRELEAAIDAPETLMTRWRDHLIHREGDHIAVRLATGTNLAGSFAGLTSEGFLRLTTSDGEVVVSGGDVTS